MKEGCDKMNKIITTSLTIAVMSSSLLVTTPVLAKTKQWNVAYMQSDNKHQYSMIQTDHLWQRKIIYKNKKIIIKQTKMMNYMRKLTFDGVKLKATRHGKTGTWYGYLSAKHLRKIRHGRYIKVKMQYHVPKLFTHNVSALVKIK